MICFLTPDLRIPPLTPSLLNTTASYTCRCFQMLELMCSPKTVRMRPVRCFMETSHQAQTMAKSVLLYGTLRRSPAQPMSTSSFHHNIFIIISHQYSCKML